jgi:hypothetical protein
MEETKSGVSPTGLVILLVLLFLFMRQGFFGGNGFGWGNGFPGFGGSWGPWALNGAAGDIGFQNYRATCDAEKTEMMNFADIQHQISTTSAATQASIYADGNATRAMINEKTIQELRDRLSDAQRENLTLSNQLFVKDQIAPITAQLTSIQNNMLVRPNVTGVGAVCPNAGILNGLGITNGGCGGSIIA